MTIEQVITLFIPLAAPIVTLIASIAALIGVYLTQKHNRQTKLIELKHNEKIKDKELEQGRRLKTLELQEENRRTLRSERRSIYKDVLRDSRYIFHYWYDVGNNYWYPGAGPLEKAVDPDDVAAGVRTLRHYHQLKDWQAETDSVASEEVVELIGALADFVRNCEQRALYELQSNGITDPTRQDILWRGVQDTIKQEFKEQGVHPAYFNLRRQIREELTAE